MSTLAFSETELRASVGLGLDELAIMEQAFSSTVAPGVVQPPILNIPVGDRGGRLEAKSGFVAGLPRVAIKLLMGFPDNQLIGLPTWNSMMVLCNATTGACDGLMMDNSYLTDIRTALAGAVAAKHMAPKDCDTVGVIGIGTQGRLQIRALALVRTFSKVLVWGRNPEKVAAYIKDMSDMADCEFIAAPDIETVVRGSRIVITATPSMEALVRADWVQPGQHITAMGSDIPGMQELEPEILKRADILACDNRSQCAEIGELQHAYKAGLLDESSDIPELGHITSGARPGRISEGQLTVCDLTGIGVQDTAIANIAYDRAQQNGYGTKL